MPGARCTRSLVCAMGSKYAHEYSQRVTGKHPTFPHAMVYGLYRALPGDRLSCHRRRRLPANLTPASGCQDHASSPSAASNARQARRRVHRIPPRVRDVASRPSIGTRRERYTTDLRFRKNRIFFQKGLDIQVTRRVTDLPVGQISRAIGLRNSRAMGWRGGCAAHSAHRQQAIALRITLST
jgi:hypothetical protein